MYRKATGRREAGIGGAFEIDPATGCILLTDYTELGKYDDAASDALKVDPW